jgi:outer membrane protein assembly factor BamD (BamD/ComL family)
VHWDRSKPFLDIEGRALQILEQVHYNDPTGPCSDKALYLLGYVNFYNGNFKEADLFFSQLVETHANSPLRPRAAELAIMAKNNSTGGPDYDGRPSAEALQLVHKARAEIPELAERAQFLDAQAVAIRQQQADKDMGIADFYRRTGHAGSAYFYYELVRRRYPDTEHARKALQRMHELHGELEESRRPGDFWTSTRRGLNKYVLGTPEAELPPGRELPQTPAVLPEPATTPLLQAPESSGQPTIKPVGP